VPISDFFDRGVSLILDVLRRPSFRAVEVIDRFGAIDAFHDVGAHVLVLEPKCVPRFVPYHPSEFRLRGAHREPFEI
jgi:hypothetical protein